MMQSTRVARLFGCFVFIYLALAFVKAIRAMAATVLAAVAPTQQILLGKNNIALVCLVVIAGLKF